MVINVDITNGISMSTWQFGVDGVEVIPMDTPFTNEIGDYPTSYGGVDFYSVSSDTELYMDDFHFMGGFFPIGLAGTGSENFIEYSVYPNPANNFLNIDSKDEIHSIKIYSMEGSLVLEKTDTKNIDVSQITSGLYFVEVSTPNGRSTLKFIKQ